MPETNPGTTNLVSWWALEENGGTAYDSHGTNHLTETSGTIPAASGKVGSGRDFEKGETEYLTIASNDSLTFADEAFTLGCWIKPESLSGDYELIFGKYDRTTNNREYALYIYVTSKKPSFFITPNGVTPTTVTWESACSTGTWYFLLAWHDPSADKIYISVNNETPVEVSYSSGCSNRGSSFRMGAAGATADHFYDGVIDEAFIFDRVLTADERSWLYNSGNGRAYTELNELESAYQMNWW